MIAEFFKQSGDATALYSVKPMKANWQFITLAGLTALLTSPARGIEAPPDNAKPPMVQGKPSEAPAVAAAPFIGIVSDRLPEALSAQLGLRPDEGIIVRSVMPDGPADKAGIQMHDIITRIGDESLSSPNDLRRIVQAHKAGEAIELGVIRKGRDAAIKVTLSERPDAMAGRLQEPLNQLPLDGVPEEMAQRMRDMIEGNVRQFQWSPDNGFGFGGMGRDLEETMRRMREQMEQLDRFDVPQGDEPGLQIQQSSTIRMLDQNGSIELSNQNGIRTLTVRDKDNQTTWSGPWTTDEDKAAAPDEVRERVDALNIESSMDGSTLRLKINPHR